MRGTQQAMTQGADELDAEGWHSLAIRAHEQGDYGRAIERVGRAIDLRGADPAHYHTLGLSRGASGDVRGAIGAFRIAAALAPGFAEALDQLGAALRMVGDWSGVVEAAGRAVALRPGLIDSRHRLAIALIELGRPGEAVAELRELVKIEPTHAGAYRTLARASLAIGDQGRAEAACRAAFALDPGPEARRQLPDVLATHGRVDEAAALLDVELRIEPTPSLRLLRATLMPPIAGSVEEIDGRRAEIAEALGRLDREGVRVEATPEALPNLFFLAYGGGNDVAFHRAFARLVARPEPIEIAPRAKQTHDKVRVGFFSVHFRDHTVGRLMRGAIRNLPRQRIEVVAISDVRPDDEVGRSIAEGADEFVAVSRDPVAARRAIAGLGLDVLVYADLGMESFTYTLACTRLAPVQCLTWGHPATSGLDTIDYFLSSDLLETDAADAHYSERLVRLPRVPIHLERPAWPADPATLPARRAALGLPMLGTLYGCPQSLFKLHPDFDPILAAILRRDPSGRLILLDGQHPLWRSRLLDRLSRTMPDVLDRVDFLPRLDHAAFLSLNSCLDVLLDPLHFGGGHTSYEALAVGTPVVTLPSPYLKGRITQALYRTMGVTSCIATSLDDYMAIALRLGLDATYRAEVRTAILAACPAIFEDGGVLGDLEAFFLGVARQ